MHKPLTANDLALLINAGEFFDGLDILFEDFMDMQTESSKKRFDVLRSEATNRYGQDNFLEFIDHTLRRAYYVNLSEADVFINRFNAKLYDFR